LVNKSNTAKSDYPKLPTHYPDGSETGYHYAYKTLPRIIRDLIEPNICIVDIAPVVPELVKPDTHINTAPQPSWLQHAWQTVHNHPFVTSALPATTATALIAFRYLKR